LSGSGSAGYTVTAAPRLTDGPTIQCVTTQCVKSVTLDYYAPNAVINTISWLDEICV
jgi:hypothetical protein